MADEPGTGQAVQEPPEAQMPETQPLEIPKTSTSASRRVRARLARRMTAQRSAVKPVLEPLVAVHRESFPKADLALLQKAFEVADERHADQMRKSGDPYITHPLAVANILAELGMDTITLVAALLHDTVEDTGYTLDQLTADFGDEVAHLVDGVTKLDKVKLGTAAEAETIRKMIIAMARDPRVLVIKVADRLHNMRTMRFLPPEKQARKARETLEVIAPLAHRLGMATVKWELEDLAFAILYPKKYDEIVRLVADRSPSRDTYLAKVRAEIDAKRWPPREGQAAVEGRPKHYWSIYQKMIVKGRDFDDIHDLVGIRVLCDEVRDCYAAVGVVHSLWQPMAGRFKDYIAQPRYGVYQSLHTTVVGPEGKPLEVQIRTRDMHAPPSSASPRTGATRRTKGRNAPHPHAAAEVDDMAWMRQLLDWQREAVDPSEFLESLRFDLAGARDLRVHAQGRASSRCRRTRRRSTSPTRCTPRSAIAASAPGSTADWSRWNASWRTARWWRCSPPRRRTPVRRGTGRTSWCRPRAKAKIRQWFAKERREEALENGKDAIAPRCAAGGLPVQRFMDADVDGRAGQGAAATSDVSARSTRRWGRTTSPRDTWCSG